MEEEERQRIVDLAVRELAHGTDDTPDDRRGAEDLCAQADEAVLLCRRADVRDVGEHPGLDADPGGPGDDGADDLCPEHGPWGYFHVVAELEVGGELQGLGHGDVARS
jgi:hypothetical protein